MNYDHKWDLSTIPDEKLKSERARRNRALATPAVKLKPCPHCGFLLTAGQRRYKKQTCPACGLSGLSVSHDSI